MTIDHDQSSYRVVRNDEAEYSLWPAKWPLPAGWRAEGDPASRVDCLAYIDRAWTDMRPASLLGPARPAHATEMTSHAHS